MFQRLTASTAWLGLWMLLLFAGCQTQGGARSTAAPVAPKNIDSLVKTWFEEVPAI